MVGVHQLNSVFGELLSVNRAIASQAEDDASKPVAGNLDRLGTTAHVRCNLFPRAIERLVEDFQSVGSVGRTLKQQRAFTAAPTQPRISSLS